MVLIRRSALCRHDIQRPVDGHPQALFLFLGFSNAQYNTLLQGVQPLIYYILCSYDPKNTKYCVCSWIWYILPQQFVFVKR